MSRAFNVVFIVFIFRAAILAILIYTSLYTSVSLTNYTEGVLTAIRGKVTLTS